MSSSTKQGLLLLNKQEGKTSFSIIPILRKLSGISKIGHAGTLDPLATGVMIFLIGRTFTRHANHFLHLDKEYLARIKVGETTSTYDREGTILSSSSKIISKEEIESILSHFQGSVQQIPPMFSAKKHQGKALYILARKGITIKRSPIDIQLQTTLLSYQYPYLDLHIHCSSGTYIRSLAHDIGQKLGCGAFLYSLKRVCIGPFHLKDCIDQKMLQDPTFHLFDHLIDYDFTL